MNDDLFSTFGSHYDENIVKLNIKKSASKTVFKMKNVIFKLMSLAVFLLM